jgi:hypothetical protein
MEWVTYWGGMVWQVNPQNDVVLVVSQPADKPTNNNISIRTTTA